MNECLYRNDGTVRSWDERLMDQTFMVATFSKDPSSKVGALITDPRHCIRSSGFNGLPRGIQDYPMRYSDRDYKLKNVVHAEVNAILNAGQPVVGFSMYLVSPPCLDCAKTITQSGISEVVAPTVGTFADRPDWAESIQSALDHLIEAGVQLRLVDYDWKARGWRRG